MRMPLEARWGVWTGESSGKLAEGFLAACLGCPGGRVIVGELARERSPKPASQYKRVVQR